MNNSIYDYIFYYKDKSTNEIKWNDVDTMICNILIYLPMNSFADEKRLSELKIKENEIHGVMIKGAYKILESIKNSTRYKDLTLTDFIITKNMSTQFGAVTYKINGQKIISFKGTDGSLIGWMENFRLGYEYPTNTHVLGIDYLKKHINIFDKNVIVTGHSKGGNLAIVATMEQQPHIKNKVTRIVNYDGPGLRKKEFESYKFESVKNKIINYLPTGSVIGALMYNIEYNVVKTSTIAFDEHFLVNWEVFGEFFLKGKLSNISKNINDRSINGLLSLDEEKMKIAFEEVFKNLEKDYSTDMKFTSQDVMAVYNCMKKIDSKVASYLKEIIFAMVSKPKK
jgi:hypothetical protein